VIHLSFRILPCGPLGGRIVLHTARLSVCPSVTISQNQKRIILSFVSLKKVPLWHNILACGEHRCRRTECHSTACAIHTRSTVKYNTYMTQVYARNGHNPIRQPMNSTKLFSSNRQIGYLQAHILLPWLTVAPSAECSGERPLQRRPIPNVVSMLATEKRTDKQIDNIIA